MIIDVINKTFKPLLFIGIVAFVCTWALGLNGHLIESNTYNGIKIYTFEFNDYLMPLSTLWNTSPDLFQDFTPTRQLDTSGWNWGNNLLYAFNWAIIFPINILTWIVRMICWLTQMILAIIGWNINKIGEQYESQLLNTLVWIVKNFKLNYM